MKCFFSLVSCALISITTMAQAETQPGIVPNIHDAPGGAPRTEQWNTTTLKLELAQYGGATASLADQQIWATGYSLASHRNASPIVGTAAKQPMSSATWSGPTSPMTRYLGHTLTAAANELLQAQP
jgi:hypothetical protein